MFESLALAENERDLNEIRAELAEQGYVRRRAGKKNQKQPALSAPLKFKTSDGFTVLVGRNNRQNDKLTMKDANNNDIWFHTKNIPGSHTVLVTDGKAPTETAMEEAAVLAAQHSRAKDSAQVPVDYTQIRYVSKPQGAKPGIVPTSGWGFAWGNGPAWDSVLIELPYRLYQYRGDLDSAKLCAPAIIKYLHYLTTRMDEHDLLAIGLGDWCPPGREAHEYKSPLAFTDTVLSKDMADKAAFLFDKLNMPEQAAFARALSKRWKAAVRKYLIDENTMLAAGNCQTSQAMAIYYNIFEPAERKAAFEQLINLIEEQEYHLDVGVLGGRVLFHVLTDFGYSDLAFSMITRPDYPSYGNWIARGATTLWELFQPEGSDRIGSLNHHFWGDISSWFTQALSGIRMAPHGEPNEVDFCPSFISRLTHAEAFHIAPAGRIASAWERDEDDVIVLTVELPSTMHGVIRLESGYVFEDGLAYKAAESGTYRIHSIE